VRIADLTVHQMSVLILSTRRHCAADGCSDVASTAHETAIDSLRALCYVLKALQRWSKLGRGRHATAQLFVGAYNIPCSCHRRYTGGPISNGNTVLPRTFTDAQRERRILPTAANTTTQNEPAAQLLCLWGWPIAACIILQPLSPEGHDTVTQHSSHSQAHCYWLCIGSCNAAHAQNMKRRQLLTVEQYLRVSVFICLLRSVL